VDDIGSAGEEGGCWGGRFVLYVPLSIHIHCHLLYLLYGMEKKNDFANHLPAKSKKQRRLAAKRLRKEQAMNPEMLVPKVPLYEQTIDLPAGDGSLQGAVKAQDAREELTKAMRNKRRAGIKEANFLKAMG